MIDDQYWLDTLAAKEREKAVTRCTLSKPSYNSKGYRSESDETLLLKPDIFNQVPKVRRTVS